MDATIVTPSLAVLQILAGIAAVVFAVGIVVGIMARAQVVVLTFGGLALMALALMFVGAPA